MVKPITTYLTQKRLSWCGHVMRREDTNVAKHVTTMKVGGKKPRGKPGLRWMDRVRSDLKQHQLDPNLTQNREGWRKAIMAIDPGQGYDRQRYAYIFQLLNVQNFRLPSRKESLSWEIRTRRHTYRRRTLDRQCDVPILGSGVDIGSCFHLPCGPNVIRQQRLEKTR